MSQDIGSSRALQLLTSDSLLGRMLQSCVRISPSKPIHHCRRPLEGHPADTDEKGGLLPCRSSHFSLSDQKFRITSDLASTCYRFQPCPSFRRSRPMNCRL